jgi:hypothetical protein
MLYIFFDTKNVIYIYIERERDQLIPSVSVITYSKS